MTAIPTLILTDEKQLERIAYAPDEPLFDDEDRGFSGERHGLYPKGTTLDSFMADAAQRGCTRVEVSYDFFFGGTTRTSYPDSEITVKAYQVICEKARAHGMTFGASLISPLDLGGGYVKTHENTGRTWQMAEADLQDGHFSLEMREQMQWYNNKGPIALRLTRAHGLRVRRGTPGRFGQFLRERGGHGGHHPLGALRAAGGHGKGHRLGLWIPADARERRLRQREGACDGAGGIRHAGVGLLRGQRPALHSERRRPPRPKRHRL